MAKFNMEQTDAVAAVIKKNPEFVASAILTLAVMFGQSNRNFMARRFFVMCGFEDNNPDDESLNSMMDDYRRLMNQP